MALSTSSTGDGGANYGRSPAGPSHYTGAAAPTQDISLPVLDLAVLRTLENELSDSSIVQSFARDYIGLWKKRFGYLSSAVQGRDTEAALDAVLSVKNSSAMVGGTRLANLALKLEGLLRRGDMTTANTL